MMNNLSSSQWLEVKAVSRTLRSGEAFVDSVLAELGRHRRPVSNDEVSRAISNALGRVPVYFTDGAPTKKGKPMATTNTTKKYRHLAWTDPQAWDENGILKDGVSVRLPLFMLDQKWKMADVHNAAQAMQDHRYNKPGFRPALKQDAAAADARADAYLEYERRLTSAYKDAGGDDDDDPTGFGSSGSVDLVEGMTCTVSSNPSGDHRFGEEGDAGVMRNVPGYGLICVSNQVKADALPARDGRSHQQVMDELYRRLDAELSQAWRNP